MTLIQRVFIQIVSEALAEIRREATTGCEAIINLRNVIRFEVLYPTSIVQCLGYYLEWRAVAFQFDQHQRPVRCNGEQIYSTTEARILLPTNQHPLICKESR